MPSLAAIGVALATWSVDDPSFNHATDQIAQNYLGYPGAAIADELMQLMGLGVLPLIGIPMAWVVNLLSHERPERPFMAILAWFASTFLGLRRLCHAFRPHRPGRWPRGLAAIPATSSAAEFFHSSRLGLKGDFAEFFTGALCAGVAIWAALRATGLTKSETTGALGNLARSTGIFLAQLLRLLHSAFMHWRTYRAQEQSARVQRAETANSSRDIISRLAPARKQMRASRLNQSWSRDGRNSRTATFPAGQAEADGGRGAITRKLRDGEV